MSDVWLAVSLLAIALLGSLVMNVYFIVRYNSMFNRYFQPTGTCRDCGQLHDEGWRVYCRVCRDIRRDRYRQDKRERKEKRKEALAWPKL